MASSNVESVIWYHFLLQLNKELKNTSINTTLYLPTSGVTPANWQYLDTTGTQSGTPGDTIVDNLEAWCNNMPLWQSNYVPGSNLYDNYSLFLYAIKLVHPGDPAQQQIADAWSKKIQSIQEEINTAKTNSMQSWYNYKVNQPGPSDKISYTDFLNLPNNGPNAPNTPSWNTYFQTLENKKENALQNYQTALEKLGGQGYKALDNALDAVTLSASAENQILDKNNVAYPKYSVSPDLNSWFTSALANSDSSPQIDFTIDIQQILANQKAGQFTDVTDAAFISSLATKDSTNLLTNMKLTFQAQQAAVFTFNPSSWLDEDFISTYASTNGSTYEINPNSSLSNKDLFGKSGIINQRTAQVLVVYKSKVQLTGSSSDIQSLQKTFSTQKNVMVAGNTFSQNQISYENTTATFESNDNTPEVIGVIVKKYGNLN